MVPCRGFVPARRAAIDGRGRVTNTRSPTTWTRSRPPVIPPRRRNCRAAASSCSDRCWASGRRPCSCCPAARGPALAGVSIWTTAGRNTCGSFRTWRRTGLDWRRCWWAPAAGPWWSGATARKSPCPPSTGYRPRRSGTPPPWSAATSPAPRSRWSATPAPRARVSCIWAPRDGPTPVPTENKNKKKTLVF